MFGDGNDCFVENFVPFDLGKNPSLSQQVFEQTILFHYTNLLKDKNVTKLITSIFP